MDNLLKLQENSGRGGPLPKELPQWLAAHTAAGGGEVTHTHGRCSTELLHLDGVFGSTAFSQACRKHVPLMYLHYDEQDTG